MKTKKGGSGITNRRLRRTARHQQRTSYRYGSIYGDLVKIVRSEGFSEAGGSVEVINSTRCFGRDIRSGETIPDEMLPHFGKRGCMVKSGAPIDMSDNQDSDEDDVWNYTFNFANIIISVNAQEGTRLYDKLIDIKERFEGLEVGRGSRRGSRRTR